MYPQAYQKRHSFLHHAFFESYLIPVGMKEREIIIHNKKDKIALSPTGTTKKDTAFCHAFLRQYNNTTMYISTSINSFNHYLCKNICNSCNQYQGNCVHHLQFHLYDNICL